MRSFLLFILLLVMIIAAGYYGLPILIEQETSSLYADVQHLKERISKLEDFVRAEEKARESAELPPDADFQHVIQSVNAIASKVISLEDAVQKNIAKTDATITEKQTATDEALRMRTETVEKINRDLERTLQSLIFKAELESIRGHLLKTRIELVSRNIGTVKNELDTIFEAFEKIKATADDEKRAVIAELQETLKRARSELDIDLPAATNKIDLVWHELSKLLRKT